MTENDFIVSTSCISKSRKKHMLMGGQSFNPAGAMTSGGVIDADAESGKFTISNGIWYNSGGQDISEFDRGICFSKVKRDFLWK